mgnify:CR=1 FL=1
MKISEMNNCIEKMRAVGTRDENGTQIEMTRRADELEQ